MVDKPERPRRPPRLPSHYPYEPEEDDYIDSTWPLRPQDERDQAPPPGADSASPMHGSDRRLFAHLGIPVAILVGAGLVGLGIIFTGWPHTGFALATSCFLAAFVMWLRLSDTKLKAPPNWLSVGVLGTVAIITWLLVGWQTWIWSHPLIQPVQVQGYTQAQYDDAIAKAKDAAAKPLQNKLDQANKDSEALRQSTAKQIADAVAKATAQSPVQSDTPISVDKLPTSVKLLLKGSDYEEIDLRNVISTTKLIVWRQRSNLLTTQTYPGLAVVIVFKKPLAYSDVHIDDHGAGISTFELTNKNPRYAIITLDTIYFSGLIDIAFTK